MPKGLFIASTRQHIGKTTTSLGLFSLLRKKLGKISYFKPIGQENVLVKGGLRVDKDVVLFKQYFKLSTPLEEMSPVLIPPGFTRDFLDKKIDAEELVKKIQYAYERLVAASDGILVEGTGHCGVGSIINLNNAQVAALLRIPALLITSGGLGSAFDELMLNKTLCDAYQVPIIGVILNRVRPEKQEMITHYMTKALKKWNLPLLGSIPYDPLLSRPTMRDFETLFNTSLLTGKEFLFHHFENIRLVATSVETYREKILPSQLLITPANREDLIIATIGKYWQERAAHPEQKWETGMILTGEYAPRHFLLEELTRADIPMLYTPLHSDTVLEIIHSFTAKIQIEDIEKVEEAISLVENHIDIDKVASHF